MNKQRTPRRAQGVVSTEAQLSATMDVVSAEQHDLDDDVRNVLLFAVVPMMAKTEMRSIEHGAALAMINGKLDAISATLRLIAAHLGIASPENSPETSP